MMSVSFRQNNREACAKYVLCFDHGISYSYIFFTSLAERCAQMLLDLNDIMRDKWETAPPALLRNLTKYTE